MARTSVSASRVLTPEGWVGPARVVLDGDAVAAVEPCAAAPDRWLAAGSVDLQVNGIGEVDVATADGADWDYLDARLLAHGVTTWCPTLVTMPLPRYAAPLGRVQAAMRRTRGAAIAGVHLEGPFLGGAPGAHRHDWVVPVDLDWLAALPRHVAVVTLGAEHPDVPAAVELLRRRGVLVSVGHTRATEAEFDAAVGAGARLVTHLFNGMSGVHHREPGVAVFALTEPRVAASLIADGVHVHPRVLRLAFHALGPGRAVLVTDSVAWPEPGTTPRLPDGTLAGSTVTMDAALRTVVAAGVDPLDALTAATATPARLLGLADRGTVAPGLRADLVAYTPDLFVEQVWAGGTAVHR